MGNYLLKRCIPEASVTQVLHQRIYDIKVRARRQGLVTSLNEEIAKNEEDIPSVTQMWREIYKAKAKAKPKRQNWALASKDEEFVGAEKEALRSQEEATKIQSAMFSQHSEQVPTHDTKAQSQEETIQQLKSSNKALEDKVELVDFMLMSAKIVSGDRKSRDDPEDAHWKAFRTLRNAIAHAEYKPFFLPNYTREQMVVHLMQKDLTLVPPRFVCLMAAELKNRKVMSEEELAEINKRFGGGN